jgi:inosine-uridine nucleoside N-ribohydrolase
LLGPLTNIALAICMSDKFKAFLEGIEKGRFVIMGGAHTSKGNSGMASEFNMYDYVV